MYVKNNTNSSQIIGTSNGWLANEYPTLEHFELVSRNKIDTVIQFLKLNRNIHTFSTTIEFMIENKESFIPFDIKLNVLSILHSYTNIDTKKFNAFVKQLSEHQKHGLFQQLHLYFHSTIEKYIYPQGQLSFVTIWHCINGEQHFALESMINLERMYLLRASLIDDLDAALSKVTKLNYIFFSSEAIDKILTFIRGSSKLRKIKFYNLLNGIFFNSKDSILDLSALNDERSKCAYANRLTIYVNEKIYLATKSALKQTKFSLIEIKRYESDAEFHDFASFFSGILF